MSKGQTSKEGHTKGKSKEEKWFEFRLLSLVQYSFLTLPVVQRKKGKIASSSTSSTSSKHEMTEKEKRAHADTLALAKNLPPVAEGHPYSNRNMRLFYYDVASISKPVGHFFFGPMTIMIIFFQPDGKKAHST
jgi:hypothetical protein